MEVALGAQDAMEWSYRGEGAANLVLFYCGRSPQFVGKVLRIQKDRANGSENRTGHSSLNIPERHLWKDVKELVSAPTREIAGHFFAQHVMAPLLGPKHVDAGVCILVSKEFLEAVEKNALQVRPPWRVDAAKVNLLSDSAILMSDHSTFPHVTPEEELCICVEIKISYISGYDPLDMFSESKDRLDKAMMDLFMTPQNNFRVFLNGSLKFGGLGGVAEATNAKDSQEFEDVLKNIILAEEGLRTKYFLGLISEALLSSEILNRLLEVQKLDILDIEGAIHVYYNFISQPCMVCRELGSGMSKRFDTLHSLSTEESEKILRDYLIATTAKDLGIMISFKPQKDGNSESAYSLVSLKSTNQHFNYKVSFIDLDLKYLNKMEFYYELDQKIVKSYIKMVNGVNQTRL